MEPTNDELAALARNIIRDAIADQLHDRMTLGEQLEDCAGGLSEDEFEALIDRLERAIRWEARELLPLADAFEATVEGGGPGPEDYAEFDDSRRAEARTLGVM